MASTGPALAHVKDLRLTLGGAAPLFDGAEFVLHKGERVAFIGANGAGKSTLMRMLAGLAEPDAGEIVYTSGVKVALAPQDSSFDGFSTLRDCACAPSVSLRGSTAPTPEHAAEAALEAFGLDPDRAPQGMSGGEARRATLARALAADPDILLLDEPTNHLDLTTREALSIALNEFEGSVILVSHDRSLLRAVCDEFWLVAKGGVHDFVGDLDDYQRYLLDEARRSREILREAAKTTSKQGRDRRSPGRPEKQNAGNLQALKRAQGKMEQALADLQREQQSLEASLLSVPPQSSADLAANGRRLHAITEEVNALEEQWLALADQIDEATQHVAS